MISTSDDDVSVGEVCPLSLSSIDKSSLSTSASVRLTPCPSPVTNRNAPTLSSAPAPRYIPACSQCISPCTPPVTNPATVFTTVTPHLHHPPFPRTTPCSSRFPILPLLTPPPPSGPPPSWSAIGTFVVYSAAMVAKIATRPPR